MQLFKKIILASLVMGLFVSFGTTSVKAVTNLGTFSNTGGMYSAPANSGNVAPVRTASASKTNTTVGGGNPGGSTVIGGGNSNTGTTVGGGNPGGSTVIGGGNNTGSTETIVNPLKGIKDLPSFLKVVLGAMIQLGEVIIVLAFVWIGFLFVKAQGAPAEIKKARDAFFWTVIGGLILLSANAILLVVQSTASSLSN